VPHSPRSSVLRAAPALVASVTLFAASARAQSTVPRTDSAFDFSIRNIMRGPELYGRPPENVRWSADGKWIYFRWVEAGKDWRVQPAPFRVRATPGATPERLTIAQGDSLDALAAAGSYSPDRRSEVVASGGDLWVVTFGSGAARRLTRTSARESDPVFSSDGRRIYFARDDNAYAFDLASGFVTQLTNLRTGAAPEDTLSKQAQKVRMRETQRALFQSVRDQLAADSLEKHERETLDSLHSAPPIYVGKDRTIQGIFIAPSGRGALVVLRTPSKATPDPVPFWITQSGYAEPHRGRSLVGDSQSRAEVLWVSFADGHTAKPKLFANDSLASYLSVNGWDDAGTHVLVLAFRPDNKERILYSLTTDGALHQIESLRDTAWVGGPCSTCAGWTNDGKRAWYVSEATGFAHLYTAAPDGSDARQLTSGRWEVRDVQLSRDGRTFYLVTNRPSPFEEQFYTLPVNGGPLTQVTRLSGRHEVVVSPDGRSLADVHSYVNRPPDLYVMPNRAGAAESQLTRSASAEWLRGPWIAPKIVMIPASDGAQVPAHIYRPEEMGAKPNGAAVIFVHGAGYLHNVGNFWSEYPREYMFNQYLAAHGYVVLDADYRASDGYGRDWRTAIYRWMGGRDLQDEVDVSKYITANFNIPPRRIGIYGGSYGGFMTLMALFTEPDHFGAGAALRSVTDWAHYNHGYTSAILNLPQDDTLAYHRSSPIYFAEGLRAPLLMAHGMVDTNVHFEDIVHLTERLIELGKPNWQLAPYPVEDHSFVRPASWTDEYTRIFDLFERTIAQPQ